ncbi:MAG TPA: hypothetical protein VH062_12835 [Polyangiaceae bacterium]|nr:hypothetical protein [Polyangiaceae bacterium]
MAGSAGATPKPHEPPPKPKPAVTAAPAVTATATATATAAPAATTTAAAAATAAAAGSAAPATSGVATTAVAGAVPHVPAGLSTGTLDSRLAALTKLIAERKTTVDARRQTEQDQTRTRWGSLVDQPAVVAELKTHAERSARLSRIEELAEVEAKPAVASRAARAVINENSRHEKQMQTLAGGAK